MAADLLERTLHVSISYEEPAWLWKGDQIQAAEHPANKELTARNPAWKGPIVPVGGTVDVSFPSRYEAQLTANPLNVLEGVLNNYTVRNNPGEFKIVQFGAGQFSIVPNRAHDLYGNMVRQSSPFDALITFPVAERSRLETISVIFKAITNTGHYKLSNGPVGGSSRVLSAQRIQLGAANEVARDVLAKALAGAAKYSWRLFFDPATEGYAFNLHRIS